MVPDIGQAVHSAQSTLPGWHDYQPRRHAFRPELAAKHISASNENHRCGALRRIFKVCHSSAGSGQHQTSRCARCRILSASISNVMATAHLALFGQGGGFGISCRCLHMVLRRSGLFWFQKKPDTSTRKPQGPPVSRRGPIGIMNSAYVRSGISTSLPRGISASLS